MTAARLLTANALAQLGVPGLPGTKRGIHQLRVREGWPMREAGGALLIDVNALPTALRAAIDARLGAAQPELPLDHPDANAPANANVQRGRGRPRGSDWVAAHPHVAEAATAYVMRQRLAAPRVHELLTTRFEAVPPLRTLQRFIERLERENAALLTSFRDPDAFKSRFRPALGRADASVTRAHEVWELDTTKADVLTRGGRMSILGLIDRWSRRTRFLVAPSESGQSVRRLLVSTIEAWGVVPETVATDNGSGYINQSVMSALPMLGIAHHICPPGSPEKKPFVERVFGTFTRERAELLAGYAGHNVAQAQALRARAKKETGRALVVPELTAEQLQAILDAWLDGVYHVRVHSSLGCPPLVRWQSSPIPARAAPPRDQLIIALSARVGAHKVGKRGIEWKRGRYWSPALAPWIGRMVEVRRDEDDLGALFVFDEDGRFIDTAVNHARAGLSEEEFATAAQSQVRAFMRTARDDARRSMAKFRMEDARDDLLRRDAERAGKLAVLPLPTRAHETPTLASLAEAEAPTPANLTSARPVASADIIAMPEPNAADAVAARVARAEALIANADAGHDVDAAQLAWAQAFVTGSACRAFVAGRDRFADGHAAVPRPAFLPIPNRGW